MSCMETSLVCQGVINGDFSQFWNWWSKNQSRFFNLCLSRLRDYNKAEDALSCVLVKALEKLPKYADGIKNIESWLVRMVTNLCYDQQREYERYSNPIDDLWDQHLERAAPETPETEVFEQEEHERVLGLLSRLSPGPRDAFYYKVIRDESYAEIAARSGISEAGVRKRIQRARKSLRVLLKAEVESKRQHSPGPEIKDHDTGLEEVVEAVDHDPQSSEKEVHWQSQIEPCISLHIRRSNKEPSSMFLVPPCEGRHQPLIKR